MFYVVKLRERPAAWKHNSKTGLKGSKCVEQGFYQRTEIDVQLLNIQQAEEEECLKKQLSAE